MKTIRGRSRPRNLAASPYCFLVQVRVYRTRVGFVIGRRPSRSEWGAIARRFELTDANNDEINGPHNFPSAQAIAGHYPRGSLVYLPTPTFDADWFDDLTHELLHVVIEIADDCSNPISKATGESHAYLIGWLTGEVMCRMMPYLKPARGTRRLAPKS